MSTGGGASQGFNESDIPILLNHLNDIGIGQTIRVQSDDKMKVMRQARQQAGRLEGQQTSEDLKSLYSFFRENTNDLMTLFRHAYSIDSRVGVISRDERHTVRVRQQLISENKKYWRLLQKLYGVWKDIYDTIKEYEKNPTTRQQFSKKVDKITQKFFDMLIELNGQMCTTLNRLDAMTPSSRGRAAQTLRRFLSP